MGLLVRRSQDRAAATAAPERELWVRRQQTRSLTGPTVVRVVRGPRAAAVPEVCRTMHRRSGVRTSFAAPQVHLAAGTPGRMHRTSVGPGPAAAEAEAMELTRAAAAAAAGISSCSAPRPSRIAGPYQRTVERARLVLQGIRAAAAAAAAA